MNIQVNDQRIYEQSLGKAPLYFITNTSSLPAGKEAFYFRVLSEASVTFVNVCGGTPATSKTLAVGEEFWGRFTTLTVASGELLAYTLG